jgi:antitoxin (DNA-binding transcriptional repressor) of toxin-antitoxin stability system
MSLTVSVEEAQGKLKELISQLSPGDELIITENDRPIATLSPNPVAERKRRVPGLGKGMITIVSDDDEHLDDFAEYMP